MPTPSERNAMLFFAAVALLGGAVRLHRATDQPIANPAADSALRRQIAEVDSERQRMSRSSRSSRSSRGPRRAGPVSSPTTSTTSTTSPLDLDSAPAESLERLPRIGPSLARRITADRDSLGPFGSLEGFQRVKGVGPAMARAIAPYVTFSGTPRPSPVGARVSARRRVSPREPRDARAPP